MPVSVTILLKERLRGIEVAGIDNINDYYDLELKFARLADSGIPKEEVPGRWVQSRKYPNYRFLKLDLTDREALYDLFREEGFTHVVHLAAQAGVRYSLINPDSYIQSNIVGFTHLLEACRHSSIQHLVYASSSSVYGDDTPVPYRESARTDHPVSLYAATKKTNELLAYAYSRLYKLPTTGIRFFTVYGPWGRPDMAPWLFMSAITKNETIRSSTTGRCRATSPISTMWWRVVKIVPVPPKVMFPVSFTTWDVHRRYS